MFMHTDLPEKYRFIFDYLKNKHEPVAIYAAEIREFYTDKFKIQKKSDRRAEHNILVVRLWGDAVNYLQNFPVMSSPNP